MSENKSSYVFLISSILKEGRTGYLKIKAADIRPADLDQETAPALSFIYDYWKNYGDVPSIPVFMEQFGVELPVDAGSNVDFWIDRVIKRKLTDQAYAAVTSFGAKAGDNIYEAMKPLEEVVSYYRTSNRQLSVQFPKDLVETLVTNYQDAKKGIKGINTPWDKMDDWTQGWNPGNLCFVGARSGKGKTFFTILAMRSAIKSMKVKRVLYASGEMTPDIILQRYAVIERGIAYESVRKGNLGPFQESEYFKFLRKEIAENEQIAIINIGKTRGGFSLKNIQLGVELYSPDLLIVDASYMLKLEDKFARNQFDIMAKVAEGLKELSLKHGIPTIASTQLNRQSLTKTSNDDSDFALSDQIAWNSDFMFIMAQSDDQARSKVMEIKPIKIREGANDRNPLKVNWDFDRMNFDDSEANVRPIRPVIGPDVFPF